MKEGDRVRTRATKNAGILRKDTTRRSSIAWYVERDEVPPDHRFYMGADELEHFLEPAPISTSHAEREAMRRVIQRLAEFEPHCAWDLQQEFLPDAKWEETQENGIPQCDAHLILPDEEKCTHTDHVEAYSSHGGMTQWCWRCGAIDSSELAGLNYISTEWHSPGVDPRKEQNRTPCGRYEKDGRTFFCTLPEHHQGDHS